MNGGLSAYDAAGNGSVEESSNGATKILARGISRATENAAIISDARLLLTSDGTVDTPEFTFSLPDLTIYPDHFRQFMEKELIEGGCLVSLESAGRLNWWCGKGNRVLWPLATTGDGNCLLHAASLGMWGFHDRGLTLRDALYNTLSTGEYRHALFRRWRWRQMELNAAAGLAYTESEWLSEWQSIVEMASANPRSQTATSYQSLEEIHILALAHVLCRPVIVIAETMLRDAEGVALAPIPFGGVYLPLEVHPSMCHRTPLFLAYHSAHFSPLVTVDSSSVPGEIFGEDVSIPLIDPDTGQLCPVLFAVDPGPDWNWSASQDLLPCPPETMEILIREYLDCEYQCFTIDEVDRLSDSDSAANKNKTTKQLLGVAKQFGSIGKSMSKKFWAMTRGVAKSHATCLSGPMDEGILCVKMRSRRHKYVDQMLQNYLQNAQNRYEEIQQKENAGVMNYGAGKSKFYTTADSNTHASVSKIPASNPNKDRTLYLSRSTFYNDRGLPEDSRSELQNSSDNFDGLVKTCRNEDCQFFGSAENQYFCSQCWANRRQR